MQLPYLAGARGERNISVVFVAFYFFKNEAIKKQQNQKD